VKAISRQSKRARVVPGASMGDHLIGWPLKTSLDLRLIEEAVVFSTHDIGQSRLVHICHHRIIAILAIQSQDGLM
jgi:hypothetical protein